MSLTNNTSAGEFAALSVIGAGAPYLEMAVTQLIINLRYLLMSAALSQKLDPGLPLIHRLLVGFEVTDEVFGVSIAVDGRLNPYYTYGMMCMAIPGWALGSCLGVVMGNALPARIVSALSLALYAMFLAIIVPPARKKPCVGRRNSCGYGGQPGMQPAACAARHLVRHAHHHPDRFHCRRRSILFPNQWRTKMQRDVYVYILVMATVTYLIRVLPLTLIRRQVKNTFLRSFLFYVPYVTLAVMTFPAILHATGSPVSAWAGFLLALVLAWRRRSLFQVAVAACALVFVAELILL